MVKKMMALILTSIILSSCGITVKESESIERNLLIPAYFYPDGNSTDWQRIFNINTYSVVVLNPGTYYFPESGTDYENYKTVIEKLNSKGFTPIGYVATNYGGEDIADVKARITDWIKTFPEIKGFFIDEVEGSSNYIDYYKDITNFIKSYDSNYYTVLNPGKVPDKEYFNLGNNIIIFENSYDFFLQHRDICENPEFPEKSTCIIYGVTEPKMEEILETTSTKFIYITDDDMPYPYDTLPSYFENEAELLKWR